MSTIPVLGKLQKGTFSKLESSLGYIHTERNPRGMTFWTGVGAGKHQIEAVSTKVLHKHGEADI